MNQMCDFCKMEIKSSAEYRYYTGGLYDITSKFNYPMPFICKYCCGSFCDDHRLPENHKCKKLSEWNQWGAYPQESGFHQECAYPENSKYSQNSLTLIWNILLVLVVIILLVTLYELNFG